MHGENAAGQTREEFLVAQGDMVLAIGNGARDVAMREHHLRANAFTNEAKQGVLAGARRPHHVDQSTGFRAHSRASERACAKGRRSHKVKGASGCD